MRISDAHRRALPVHFVGELGFFRRFFHSCPRSERPARGLGGVLFFEALMGTVTHNEASTVLSEAGGAMIVIAIPLVLALVLTVAKCNRCGVQLSPTIGRMNSLATADEEAAERAEPSISRSRLPMPQHMPGACFMRMSTESPALVLAARHSAQSTARYSECDVEDLGDEDSGETSSLVSTTLQQSVAQRVVAQRVDAFEAKVGRAQSIDSRSRRLRSSPSSSTGSRGSRSGSGDAGRSRSAGGAGRGGKNGAMAALAAASAETRSRQENLDGGTDSVSWASCPQSGTSAWQQLAKYGRKNDAN